MYIKLNKKELYLINGGGVGVFMAVLQMML